MHGILAKSAENQVADNRGKPRGRSQNIFNFFLEKKEKYFFPRLFATPTVTSRMSQFSVIIQHFWLQAETATNR